MLSGFSKRHATGRHASDAQLGIGHVTLSNEARLDSLELACGGMWQLLKQKHGYTDEDIVAAVHQIDAADGLVDHKHVNTEVPECPHCHRTLLSRQSPFCNWCGAEVDTLPLALDTALQTHTQISA